MRTEDNKSFSVNSGIIAAISTVIALLFYITRNAIFSMEKMHAASVISLAVILVFAPDFFRKNKLVAFLCSLLALAFAGIVLVNFHNSFLPWLLVAIAFCCLLNLVLKYREKFSLSHFLLSYLATLFIVFVIYSAKNQILSPVFGELIVNGKAVPDTLFHSAVSNSLLYEQVVSTRIHGSSPFSYHWLSHFVYAGLSVWCNMKTIAFYNWIFPPLFMGLFVKYFYLFYTQFLSFLGVKSFNSILFFPALLVYIIFLGISNFPSYFSSESLVLAHIFQFIFWMYVMQNGRKIKDNSADFLVAFSILLLLLFTKASIGLLTFIPAVYLYFRKSEKLKDYLILGISCSFYIAVCYLYLFKIRTEPPAKVSIPERFMNFTGNGMSYFAYSMSIFYLILFIIQNSWKKLIESFKSKTIIFEEIVLISILTTLVFGLFFGARKDDSFYFATTFIFLNMPLLVFIIYKYSGIHIENKKITALSYFLVLLCFVMSPQFSMIKHNSFNEKNLARNKNNLLKCFIVKLYNEEIPKNVVVSVKQNEDWFYKSNGEYKISYYFIIPAISSGAALLPINKEDLNSNAYSFPFYKNKLRDISSEERLWPQAKRLGYKKIYLYQTIDKKLIKTIL